MGWTCGACASAATLVRMLHFLTDSQNVATLPAEKAGTAEHWERRGRANRREDPRGGKNRCAISFRVLLL